MRSDLFLHKKLYCVKIKKKTKVKYIWERLKIINFKIKFPRKECE